MNQILTAAPSPENMPNLTAGEQLILDRIKNIENRVDALSKNTARNTRAITDLEEESVLFPAEAEDLSNAVRKKGVEVMGGTKAGAYKNKDIRSRVYRDIYYQMKRDYDLINEKGAQLSYKKLKRKYLKGAIEAVNEYTLPIGLQNEVDAENEAGEFDE